MAKASDHLRMLIKVARLYYQEDMTQLRIAKRLCLSRQKVQRLLRQARDEGIVRIAIRTIMGTNSDSEDRLERRFGLREAVVVETSAYEDQRTVATEIGAGAAEYLLRIAKSRDRIVISWGSALLGMVNAMLHNSKNNVLLKDVEVVQGLGGLVDPNNEVHASELTKRLAAALGGNGVLLPAPGAVGTRAARDVLYADPHVQEALRKARSANLAFVSIGALRSESILVQEGSIVSWSELAALKAKGAVGDISLRYFDCNGDLISSDLDQRAIGLTLEELKQTGHVVGIAGGAAKFKAIQGALNGQLVDVLVTDHITAERLLTIDKESNSEDTIPIAKP